MSGKNRKVISPRVRFAVLQRDGFACTYCGRRAGGSLTLQIDHVVPFSKNGPDDESNFVTACNQCNAGKADVEVVEEGASAEAPSMVGKFFHVLKEGKYEVVRQGVVEADYGFALRIRVFDWFVGGKSWYWQLVRKEDVVNDRWCWYDSAEEMRDSYDYGGFGKPEG